MEYMKYHYGGCPVWQDNGIYYKMISKHKSLAAAKVADAKKDDCDRIIKIGMWYGRFNRLPQHAVGKIRGRR